jgi:prepilin-type N-terminal cleavage/methylation domain-containing protein
MTGARGRLAAAGAPRPGRRGSGDGGFTLLEMIIAVLILSVLVGLVPRTLVSARALVDRSGAWLQARLVAEAVLNQELTGHSLKPGFFQGSIDGRRWTAELRTDSALMTGVGEGNRVLLDVKVRVPITDKESLEVETMRVGSPQ